DSFSEIAPCAYLGKERGSPKGHLNGLGMMSVELAPLILKPEWQVRPALQTRIRKALPGEYQGRPKTAANVANSPSAVGVGDDGLQGLGEALVNEGTKVVVQDQPMCACGREHPGITRVAE